MTDLRKAAEAVIARWDSPDWKDGTHTADYINALRAALAEPEQEPVAWVDGRWYEDGTRAGNTLVWAGRKAEDDFPVGTNLYTHPATPLSDEQIGTLTAMPEFAGYETPMLADFVRAVEQMHNIGVKK